MAGPRVLVIDDLDQMRDIIGRVLMSRGYQVDAAATLAQARELGPAEYDAVLIDAHLGTERGVDLVEALRAEDPAAARRCLLMTGGNQEGLPAGVALLAKPFDADQLVTSVRALVASADAPAQEDRAPRLLRLVRELRAREIDALFDRLHNGPVQDLTAASFRLAMMTEPGQAGRLDDVRANVASAASSLRALFKAWGLSRVTDTELPAAVRRRTWWLPTADLTFADGDPRPSTRPPDVPFVADVVELMLFALLGDGPPAPVSVRTSDTGPEIELTVRPDAGDGRAPADVVAALGELADALGVRAETGPSGESWQIRMFLNN